MKNIFVVLILWVLEFVLSFFAAIQPGSSDTNKALLKRKHTPAGTAVIHKYFAENPKRYSQ